MSLQLVTAPAIEPVTLAEIRAHLRIDAADGEPAPTEPTVALIAPAAAGNVDNGAHRYRVTFVTPDGETGGGAISSAVTVADKSVNGKVTVSAIPLGGSAVTSRKVYRTQAGGSTYLLLTTIADNTTTTYTDNIADASLGAGVPSANTTEDPLLRSVRQAAREYAEEVTRRALITQTWDLKLDAFPCSPIRMPRPKLQSVTSITYVDGDGVTQTWSTSNYGVDADSEPGRIYLKYGIVYPTTRTIEHAVTIRFVAGYGSAAASVPESTRQAIKILAAHYYENRQPTVQGTIVTPVPLTVESLLATHRFPFDRKVSM